jgi:hypothetical protein
MARQLQPGFVISICIARALAERDPKFLEVLRTNVAEVQGLNPVGSDAWDTLRIFATALNDPDIFPPSSKRSR